MKVIVWIALAFATLAFADEADDRASIEHTIYLLNDGPPGEKQV